MTKLTHVPLWSYHWAFYLNRMVGYILSGSSIVIIGVFCELLRSSHTNGKVHGRWHGASPCDNERTIALWTNALRAYEGKSSGLIPPGPRSRESVQFTELGKFCLLPKKLPICFSEAGKHCFACWCWTSAERNGRLYSSKGSPSAER